MAIEFSERDLEDWVEGFIHDIEPFRSAGCKAVHTERQLTLPSGQRLDLLAFTRRSGGNLDLTVLELKAVQVDGGAVIQLLNYMAEVEHIAAMLPEHGVTVGGVLVGPSITNDALAAIRMVPAIHCFHEVRPRFLAAASGSTGWSPTPRSGHPCIETLVGGVCEMDSYIQMAEDQEAMRGSDRDG